jgi:prepilin signal peptidase PulO-like enzyme (type II secretory pathway)
VVTPRSRCPHCGKPVEWRDNIPVLSWLLLRGNAAAAAPSASCIRWSSSASGYSGPG